jgi:carboxypeptidase Taq
MSSHPAYSTLESLFGRIQTLEDTAGLLYWDMATTMPAGSADTRGEQLATLSSITHEMLTAKDVASLLAQATSEMAHLNDWQWANLREMKQQYVHAMAVPNDLVAALSKAQSDCEILWREAKEKGDFTIVQDTFAALLALVKETAAAKSAALGCSAYDALLDTYDPGLRQAQITPIFDTLAETLPSMVDHALATQKTPIFTPKGAFSDTAQMALARAVMEDMGFDFNRGRLDVSHHPFCGGTPNDTRITTRFDPHDFTMGLFGVVHETGHALYEQHLPTRYLKQPVGKARGMSLHESQSLLWEKQIGHSFAFATYLCPKIAHYLDISMQAENLHADIAWIEKGHIRVDADELTYPLHIIMRTRLEQDLLSGDLAVQDLPEAWRAQSRTLLGLTPKNDAEGCLQDIHWYGGSFGYFPTYTLGAVAAAQIMAAFSKAHPTWEHDVAAGEFGTIQAWLAKNIHSKGSQYSMNELLTNATGSSLKIDAFLRHLRTRYQQ